MNFVKKIPMKYSIAIFDDNQERLTSVSLLIGMSQDFECTCVRQDCSNLLEDIAETRPDLVLMDINMPVMNGIEATRLLKKNYPSIPVIIQTVFEDDENLFNCLKAGANGYLLKSMNPEKFINAIYEALKGGAPMSSVIAVKVLNYFKAQTAQPEEQFNLTTREKQILSSLVDGLSYKQIAAQHFIAYNTVNNHVRNIYEKLHVNSNTEAVSLAIKNKLV